MSDTAAWLPAAGAIALLIVSYWLRFWARRELIYRPLRERRDRTDARRRGGSTSDPGATTAGRELADRPTLDTANRPQGREVSSARRPRTADPSTAERIATGRVR